MQSIAKIPNSQSTLLDPFSSMFQVLSFRGKKL